MSGHAITATGDVRRPKAWKYILGAVLLFPLLFLLWVAFDYFVWHPELANVEVETTMDIVRWFAVPALLVAVTFGGKWAQDSFAAREREQEWQQKTQQLKDQEAAARTEKARREYVLEVLGLGVTYEKYRQGKLWNALQQGNPHTSIRERDPKKYEWSWQDKFGNTGSRTLDALENGAEPSPMFWGVPTMYAGIPIADPAQQPSEISPEAGFAASAESTGMAWHLFVTGPWQLSERPDKLLEQAFELFDKYSDLPYLVLLSNDDMSVRDGTRIRGTPTLIKDGYYIPARPDAAAVFVLARRERVEPLRPYVWDDPDNDYLQENLRRMYFKLGREVPNPEKLAHPQKFNGGRQPTVAEWLQAAVAFAKNPVFEKKDGNPLLDSFKRWANHPPRDWKPTPWFPVPWNREQMQAFDNLPSLGFIHRPVFVKFEDEHGKPVTRRDARQKLLEAGWQQALQTLPDAERAKGPARIVAAFDNNVDHLVAMEGMLHQYAAQGGPEIDSGKTAQFINTDRRLGNTGAATFFVQMALGVMGSYIGGGTSAAVNLRDPTGASIVFISPPSEQRRKAQEGWDVFKHQVKPAIDPDNYKPPTVGAVLGKHEAPDTATATSP
jgi:hypothetical protein